MNEEQQLDPVSIDTEEDEEIEPLSGNPMFHVTLYKSHVSSPYQLTIPAAIAHILPYKTAPVASLVAKRVGKQLISADIQPIKDLK